MSITLAVLLCNSQAILAGLLATLLVVYERGLLKRSRIVKLFLLSVLVVLLAGLLLRMFGIDFLSAFSHRSQYLMANIADPDNTAQVTSFADRFKGIQIGLEVWSTHPILGVGLGSMGYHSGREWTNNAWLQVMVEQRILGLLALVMVFWSLWRGLRGQLKADHDDSFWQPVTISMLLVLLLTMIDGLFTFNWTDPLRIFTLAMANLVYIQTTAGYRTSELMRLKRMGRLFAAIRWVSRFRIPKRFFALGKRQAVNGKRVKEISQRKQLFLGEPDAHFNDLADTYFSD